MHVRLISNIILVTVIIAVVIAELYYIYDPPPPPPKPRPPGILTADESVIYDGSSFIRLQRDFVKLNFEYTISFDLFLSPKTTNKKSSSGMILGFDVPNVKTPYFDATPTLIVYIDGDNYINVFQSPPSQSLAVKSRFIVPSKWTHVEVGSRLLSDKAKRQLYLNIDGTQVLLGAPVTPHAIETSQFVVGGRPNQIFKPEINNFKGCIRKLVVDKVDDMTFVAVGNAKRSTSDCT